MYNPATGEAIAEVPLSTLKDVEQAVQSESLGEVQRGIESVFKR